MIGERVARLPADLHETLTIGSVIGQEFAAQVVGRVQKVDERAAGPEPLDGAGEALSAGHRTGRK